MFQMSIRKKGKEKLIKCPDPLFGKTEIYASNDIIALVHEPEAL